MSSRKLTEREQWFISRAGKRIFRNKTPCDCLMCGNVFKKGLILSNESHALYVAETEAMYQMEGERVKYFDTKEEAEAYKKKTQNKNSGFLPLKITRHEKK